MRFLTQLLSEATSVMSFFYTSLHSDSNSQPNWHLLVPSSCGSANAPHFGHLISSFLNPFSHSKHRYPPFGYGAPFSRLTSSLSSDGMRFTKRPLPHATLLPQFQHVSFVTTSSASLLSSVSQSSSRSTSTFSFVFVSVTLSLIHI